MSVKAESDSLGIVELGSEFLTVEKLRSGYHRIAFESDGQLNDTVVDTVLGTVPNDEIIVLTCPDGLTILP